MISLYGCGFVGREFNRLFERDVCVIPREERKPKSNDILYMISTTHNYHVHDRITLDVDTNLHVLCEVLEHCRSEDITFNFVSSWFVYGAGGNLPAKEDDDLNPNGFYSITKLCAEDLIRSFAQTYGMRYRILRLCNVLGYGDTNATKQKNAVTWMINELKDDRDVKIYDDGSHTRDFMHVTDVCNAIKLIIDKGAEDEIYNIGSGQPTTIREVLEYAKYFTNSKGNLNSIKTPDFHKVVQGLQHFYMDNSKLKSLGFDTLYDVKDMVRELCQ
tara:strand:+ start:32 stop:850 length:819 start_codon:yes stop_codon:yes gene_type:complete